MAINLEDMGYLLFFVGYFTYSLIDGYYAYKKDAAVGPFSAYEIDRAKRLQKDGLEKKVSEPA